jgi:hypothetical protein
MAAVMQLYNSDGTIRYKDYSFGLLEKGETVEITFRVYNNKDSFPDVNDATDVYLYLKTFWYSTAGVDVIDDGWISIKCTTYGDTEFTKLITDVKKQIGSTTGVNEIPNGEYAIITIKIEVPNETVGDLRNIGLAIDFDS